jgi:ferredoxin
VSTSIRVDMISCTGQGLCADWFPERIELDEWGYPIIDPAPLNAEQLTMARRAAKECPARALWLARTDPP